VDILLGVGAGYRQLKDPDIGAVYGGGWVFLPSIRAFPFDHYGLEFSLEEGYRKHAPIGLFRENSTLSIRGARLCAVFRHPVWKLVPSFKFGAGYFRYRQDIKSEYVRRKVDHHRWTTVVSGRIAVCLYRRIFLSLEVEYVPLKVQPFEIPVDLGGVRLLAGVGFALSL